MTGLYTTIMLDKSLAICLSVFAAYTLHRIWVAKRRPPPPGPKGWPVIGNLFDLPKEKEWVTWAKWGDQYGNVTSVNVLGTTLVILNDFASAQELLDKRSAIYSERPSFPMVELCGWGNAILLLPYGPLLRSHRKLVHKVMGSSQMPQLYPIQEQETSKFVKRLMETPEKLFVHIHDNIASIILRTTYGYNIVPEDPLVAKVEEAVAAFAHASSPAFLVNTFPILRHVPDWMPGASFKQTAHLLSQSVDYIATWPLNWVKEHIANGNAPTSYVSTHISAGEDEDVIKWSAASLYTAGSDTTVISIEAFFKAMMLHPEVQAKAQAELDALGQLPTLANRDQGRLPYIEAILWEVLRWHVVFPCGVPHVAKEDDVYGPDGYFIPKGAVVLQNLWQMCHDPAVYANPAVFCPERFLGGEGESEPDPREVVFGFGRRVCVGRYMSEASIFLTIAMTLAIFDIRKCDPDEVVEVEQMPGTLSRTPPFKCDIKPRSERAIALLNALD
ncbi:cytochrome P450 [Hymenopellis radicata]|nr:cytochrome P450 [Hymenopellis radicata]